MEAKTLQVFLRVLYTVNNNPQYILAKSSSQVLAIPCSEATAQPATNEPVYARAPLRACLAAVCDSSPELLQDPARDFSLYFLDPLEAQPLPTGLAQAPRDTTSPRGVAVALGLMSWALESNNSTNVFVTGTIVPNASLALEVVCALRETKRMPKPMFHSYPPLGSIPTFIPSQLPHPLQTAWSFNSYPQLEQQQTLTRSADFPEVYIGPPRRGRGRPEGSSSKSKLKAQTRSSSLVSISSQAVDSQSEPKQAVSKQKAKSRPPRPPPTYPPFVCAPLTRSIGTAGQGDTTAVPFLNQPSHDLTSHNQNQLHAEPDRQPQPHATHNLLVGLLSALSSTSDASAGDATPEQRAALISALQGLLGANAHLQQPPSTKTLPAHVAEEAIQDVHGNNNVVDVHDDDDSDIVILDSSTIDTTVFRKASARQPATSVHDASSFIENQESPMPSNHSTDSSPLPASTPPSVQENTSASFETPTPSDTHESPSTVTAGSETPKRNFSGWVGKGDNPQDMPTTPTPSRTHKRKLDEYSQGQAHWSTPLSPPSPSPSLTRTSNSGATGSKNRAQSSPIGTAMSMSSPSMRLPSMLGSMRGIVTPNSWFNSSSDPAIRDHADLSTTEGKGSHFTKILSKSRGEHNISSGASSLKRRRTLTEFMAEQESRKSSKVRKQSSERTKVSGHVAPWRPGNVSISKYAQSSPPRPLFRSDSIVSALQPPAASSIGSSSSASTAQTKNPFKNFVVPAWARTSTATLPRLSEEALARQKAEQEAKKAQISLRRREAARTKRKQFYRADHLASKDSSDEDEETAVGDTRRRALLPLSSSATQNAPVPQPPSTLPVFASDAVASIASSPPRSHRRPAPPIVPSTPPKKPISLPGSGQHHTPSKSGSCSLFTPSGPDSMTLFTPSTPSITRSQTRSSRFTPRSPTMLRHAGGTKTSPWKGPLQTPRTPRRNDSNHCTPRTSRADRQLFISPTLGDRMSQTSTGTGTRAFLLPPPSPCAPRTPQRPRRVSGLTPIVPRDSGTPPQAPSPDVNALKVQRENHEGKEPDDALSRELNEALVVTPPAQHRHSRRDSELNDINPDGDADLSGDEYASSPLPPSSPLPASPPSSPGPTKYDDHVVPDADGQRAADTAWLLSDDSVEPTTAWFTDSDTGAWFTETEAWLTDTEGEPLPTDSDGTWLSDSDAVSSVLGNLASSLPSWFSDEVDVETDGEVDTGTLAMGQEDAESSAAAFRRVCESLVGNEGRGIIDVDGVPGGAQGPAATHTDIAIERTIDSNFWESVQPLMEEGSLNDAAMASGAGYDVQALLDSLVGT